MAPLCLNTLIASVASISRRTSLLVSGGCLFVCHWFAVTGPRVRRFASFVAACCLLLLLPRGRVAAARPRPSRASAAHFSLQPRCVARRSRAAAAPHCLAVLCSVLCVATVHSFRGRSVGPLTLLRCFRGACPCRRRALHSFRLLSSLSTARRLVAGPTVEIRIAAHAPFAEEGDRRSFSRRLCRPAASCRANRRVFRSRARRMCPRR